MSRASERDQGSFRLDWGTGILEPQPGPELTLPIFVSCNYISDRNGADFGSSPSECRR